MAAATQPYNEPKWKTDEAADSALWVCPRGHVRLPKQVQTVWRPVGRDGSTTNRYFMCNSYDGAGYAKSSVRCRCRVRYVTHPVVASSWLFGGFRAAFEAIQQLSPPDQKWGFQWMYGVGWPIAGGLAEHDPSTVSWYARERVIPLIRPGTAEWSNMEKRYATVVAEDGVSTERHERVLAALWLDHHMPRYALEGH